MISFFTIQNGNVKQAEAFKDCAVKNLSTYRKRNGIDAFIQTLKLNGLWIKVYLAYLFSSDGINATREFQHSINTKNPANTNAAFRLAWTGGTRTHTDSGAATSGYANSFFNPNTSVPNSSSVAVALFASGNEASERLSWGSKLSNLGLFGYTIFGIGGVGSFYYAISDEGGSFQSPGSAQNGFIASRINSTTVNTVIYPSNVLKTTTVAANGLPPVNMYLFGMNNNGTAQGNTNAMWNTFMVTSGLTTTEVSTLNAAIGAYNNTR